MVEPIRKITIIKELQTHLKGRSYRDFLLFNFGLNTGLRGCDIVKLKWEDIFTEKGAFKQYLTIIEKKTQKQRRMKLNDKLKSYLLEYKKLQSPISIYLFDSRKKGHITALQAYRTLKSSAVALGIENFGNHSMRKTFGYFTYNQTKNISLLMDIFNHSTPNMTMRYIGINQDQKDEISSLIQF